ncbi:MAG: class I SAM-dependent methyltransferase [Candidatus Lokiarchaeota archaeon]|nr:class I SAM-dependent methyltransferase [Candidatus Lokiarchaeota archaeon]
MYKELAKYYDLIYSWKDYKKETEKLNQLIKKYKNSDGNKLLDVACGTGNHLEYFKENFSCTGIDLNEEMIDIAKSNISDVTFNQADMIDFNLDDTFDVILCLFSSIGYLKTYQSLEKAIGNFFNHLKSGGILIIEPWFTKSAYTVGLPSMTTYDGDDIKIARLNTTKVKNNLSVMEMHYLIVKKDKDVKHFVDRHELGFFEIDKFLEIMKNAGFKAEFLEDGLMQRRGLYIGKKS